jgi:ADP-heptose:LPS heptosyltransferase
MDQWEKCKNILCIRADNMGDLLMSSPAIRALKKTFNCRITLLTSAMGNLMAPFINAIDETIVANLPWVKTETPVNKNEFSALVEALRLYQFDGVVIFTVYSQNPLPSALLAYMAGIPKRLSYCRENPYHLLTNWVVEKEPYTFIQHQVERDLNLVKMIGAEVKDQRIQIHFSEEAKISALKKLKGASVDLHKDWLIIHPGVSETKREYPENEWIKTGKLLRDDLSFQIVITGAESENALCKRIEQGIGENSFSLSGLLSVEELIALISESPVMISVNTGTVHIAAATQTPVIVLYALTNPQHTPWKVASTALFFSVKEDLRSKNEVVNYVNQKMMNQKAAIPSPAIILEEVKKILNAVNA